jgi:hypothetical protein
VTDFLEWDGGDAFGVPAEHWRENYATPGQLLFAVDEHGTLLTVVQWAPGGGTVPITAENREQVEAAIREQLTPPEPTEPPAPPVTREEFDQLRADLDWTMNYAVTGEA